MKKGTEKLRIYSQVFGKGDLTAEHHELLESKLELARTKLQLDSLMIWGAISTKSMDRITSACSSWGIEPHLWYPVLADAPVCNTEELEVQGLSAAQDFMVSEEQLETGESFAFLCPSKALVSESLISRFLEILSGHDFRGVFLDRIRFPGPTNGFGGFFSCFCGQCSSFAGEDVLEDARERYEALFSKLGNASTPDELLVALEEGMEGLLSFYESRERLVESIVSQYSIHARSVGMSVGLDLFAPSLASLVSQDYVSLSGYTDWIKPMLYCKTFGPAGLPAELLSLANIAKPMTPRLDRRALLEGLCCFLGIDGGEPITSIDPEGLPLRNFSRQIDMILAKDLSPETDIYPGFEAVDFPPVYSINHEHLASYLRDCMTFETGGLVLSWDICKMKDETIEFVGDYIERNS